MSTKIGNSGFEYTSHANDKDNTSFTIKDSETKETLFTLRGGEEWTHRGRHDNVQHFSGTKTILGKDEKYYYIATNGNNPKLNWGIVQTSGIVLKEDRTILTTVRLHPLYNTAPEVKVIPTSVAPSPVHTNQGITGANIPAPVIIPEKKPVETESLLTKLINWIERILGL